MRTEKPGNRLPIKTGRKRTQGQHPGMSWSDEQDRVLRPVKWIRSGKKLGNVIPWEEQRVHPAARVRKHAKVRKVN